MTLKEKSDIYIGHFLAFLMALMLLSVVWQVFTRYIMGEASDFTDELARYLLIWIGTLGAAYISGQKMHLAIDLLPEKLSGKANYRLNVVISLFIMVFALFVMIIGGSRLVYITFTLDQASASLQIPLAYVYSILPISGLLIIYYKVLDIMNLKMDKSPGSKTVE
ncbi:TRAP transporter small permease [Rhodohalobacter sp. 8-1]|uniref:TRAP transporter small permease n=1 Tax=Rhodohalobacter sp. 8-1 TaxID=3131972 RepID=UPI0030EB9EFB